MHHLHIRHTATEIPTACVNRGLPDFSHRGRTNEICRDPTLFVLNSSSRHWPAACSSHLKNSGQSLIRLGRSAGFDQHPDTPLSYLPRGTECFRWGGGWVAERGASAAMSRSPERQCHLVSCDLREACGSSGSTGRQGLSPACSKMSGRPLAEGRAGNKPPIFRSPSPKEPFKAMAEQGDDTRKTAKKQSGSDL